MKYLLILLLTLSANVFAGKCQDGSNSPKCDYPGSEPTWSDRYKVSCKWENTSTGLDIAGITVNDLDYPQAASLMVGLDVAYLKWYQKLLETMLGEGADARLMPDVSDQLNDIIEIERVMSGKFDE